VRGFNLSQFSVWCRRIVEHAATLCGRFIVKRPFD